ncbi:hypothetical protein L963_1503 [Leuconostoc mesenteroides subsp. cremoris T26]|nr:hypothetical protein L963_1503 [Leuconostoc mesenteroides subsp. cremoris T26]
MHRRDESVVGPTHQDVADVDDEGVRHPGNADPVAVGQLNLQAAWRVVDLQDGDGRDVGVGAGTLFAVCRRRLEGRVVIGAKDARVPVDALAEIGGRNVQRQGEDIEDVVGQALHLPVVVAERRLEFSRPLRPQVGAEIRAGIAGHVQRADRKALEQRGLELGIPVLADRLGALRGESLRIGSRGFLDAEFFRLVEREKRLRSAVEAIDDAVAHAVPRDDEKAHLLARRAHLVRDLAPMRRRVGGEGRNVDHRDVIQYGLESGHGLCVELM